MRRVLAVLGAGALASGCSASTSTTIDNEKAQASVAASHGGAQSQLGSAAGSLKRLKEQQMIREEKFKAADELEDMRTGGDLDAKLRDAGLLGGSSSADDILARLSAPASGEPLRLNAPNRDPLSLPRE